MSKFERADVTKVHMNNFELHDKAKELEDSYTAYKLARMLLEAELPPAIIAEIEAAAIEKAIEETRCNLGWDSDECFVDDLEAHIRSIRQSAKQSESEPEITDEQGRPMTYWGGKAKQPEEESGKPKTMCLKFEPHNRCMWHTDCPNNPYNSGVVSLAQREDGRDLMKCLHCGQYGYYPHGSAGCVVVEVVKESCESDGQRAKQSGGER